jgi:hypothetical protein
VRFAFIDSEKVRYPVLVLCAVLQVARNGYYTWAKRSESARAKADAQLARRPGPCTKRVGADTAARASKPSCVLAAYVSAKSGSYG